LSNAHCLKNHTTLEYQWLKSHNTTMDHGATALPLHQYGHVTKKLQLIEFAHTSSCNFLDLPGSSPKREGNRMTHLLAPGHDSSKPGPSFCNLDKDYSAIQELKRKQRLLCHPGTEEETVNLHMPVYGLQEDKSSADDTQNFFLPCRAFLRWRSWLAPRRRKTRTRNLSAAWQLYPSRA
jgi:hypothetical protein